MFGFFAPARNSRKYRQVYAAYCSHQRQTYGTVSSVFTSYEAVLLYLLALDCGVCSAPAETTPTCCRMRNDWANHWNLNRELADFCGAFAMLLAKTKLEDDRRDSKGLVPVLAGRVLRSAFAKSESYFDVHAPGLLQQIEQRVREHIELEANDFVGQSSDDLRRYARPTADAFGAIFEAFGTICKLQQPAVDPLLKFRRVGELVGATIIVADCMFDFERDRKRGEFTPLRSRGDLAKAKMLAMSLASELGWEVCELVGGKAPLCSSLVMRAFEWIGAFEIPASTNRKQQAARKPFAILPKRLSLLTNRAGDCDCGGGDCCASLCEGACAGGDCCGGGGGGCDCNGDGQSDCLHCCSSGSCQGDCCDCGGGKKDKKETSSESPAEPEDPLIGQVGEACSPLKPTGYVRVGDKQFPAQIETGSVDAGEKVIILRKGNFGYIVDHH